MASRRRLQQRGRRPPLPPLLLLLVAAAAGPGLAAGPGVAANGPPRLQRLYPPVGHTAGGALVTVHGSGFRRGAGLAARFAAENEVAEVPCAWRSASAVVCEAPPRRAPQVAQVTVSNDGLAFSGAPLVNVRGSGTFLFFTYDSSEPGCPGCVPPFGLQAATPAAARVRERWVADRAAGPYQVRARRRGACSPVGARRTDNPRRARRG